MLLQRRVSSARSGIRLAQPIGKVPDMELVQLSVQIR
jgi:hypothetical protein